LDDLARAGWFYPIGGARQHLGIARPAARQRLAPAIEPQDQGRPLESAEHHRQAPVRQQVRGGLVAAARQVEIAGRVLVEHAKRLRVLGREVDVAFRRCARREEHVLAGDETAMLGRKRGEDLCHGGKASARRGPGHWTFIARGASLDRQ
jgi:hypothetical protein